MKRIFLVEDEAVVALLLKDWIVGMGYEVCGHAARAEAALRQIPELHPDLTIMDISLGGGMTGLEAAERLQSVIEMPVIILTAYSDAPLTERAGRGQSFAYLVKPIDPRVLQANIELVLLRHETMRALRASGQRLAYAVEATSEGIWDWDITSGRVYFSPQWMRLLGYAPEDVAPTAAFFLSILDPRDVVRAQQVLDEHLAGRTPVKEVESRLRTKSGDYCWVLDRGKVVAWDEAGRPARMVGTIADISARKQTEEALRVLSTEFGAASGKTFFDEVAVRLAAIVGAEIGFVGVLRPGERAIRTLGFAIDGVAAPPMEYVVAGTPCAEVVQGKVTALSSNVQQSFPEDTALAALGVMAYVGAPLLGAAGGVVGVIGVMTRRPIAHTDRAAHVVGLFALRTAAELERQRLEDRLSRARKMESLGRLAGGIAHDFNNLLAVIVASNEVARQADASGVALTESLNEIGSAASRAGELVRQILAFSQQPPARSVVTSVGPLVDEVVRLLRAAVPTGIEVIASVSEDTPGVMIDPTQIHQVLMNLGTNAWHAIDRPTGCITFGLSTVIVSAGFAPPMAGLAPGRHVRIDVSDDGKGMEDPTLERIFDPFFTTKGIGRGTGLGLAMVHGIVTHHGGSIVVDTVPGRGTIFSVYLPESAQPMTKPQPPQESVRRGVGRILLVDDEEALARTTSRLLERFGYQVVSCVRSVDALDAVRAAPERFDLVLTDQNMPELSGVELARALAAIRADLPVVLFSGHRSHTDEELAAVSIRYWLDKPFTGAALSRVIDRALRHA